jgi:hypothetical protein
MLQSRCFKGCVSRCAVKSSGVWGVTHPITSGLPPGGTLNGAFYNTSFVYPTSWQQRRMLQSRCFKGCISRCAVKSYPFTSGLPPRGTLRDVFYNTSFVYPTCWFWLQTVTSGEITTTSGPVVAVLLRHIGAQGARDVTRAPYCGPRGARCNL